MGEFSRVLLFVGAATRRQTLNTNKGGDRKYQVWQRNSLGIPLWSDKVIWQKLEYIHYNPVSAGLCLRPEDYKYSSARFYADRGYNAWGFLVHVDG
jgi:putative transposase